MPVQLFDTATPLAPLREAIREKLTDELERTNLALPISPALDAAQVEEVVAAIAAAAQSR